LDSNEKCMKAENLIQARGKEKHFKAVKPESETATKVSFQIQVM